MYTFEFRSGMHVCIVKPTIEYTFISTLVIEKKIYVLVNLPGYLPALQIMLSS